MFNNKFRLALFSVSTFLPSSAQAHGLTGPMVSLMFALYIIPFISGMIITPRGMRFHFFKICLMTYMTDIIIGSFLGYHIDFYILFFIPYLLIPYSIYLKFYK